MKQLLYISFISLSSFLLFSCKKDFLEKRLGSDINVDSIFSTKQKSMAAIAQAYAMSLSSGIMIEDWDNPRMHGLRSSTLAHLSGELNAVKFNWEDGWKIQRSGLTANDGSGVPRSTDGFTYNYQSIRQCNLVIENIDKVTDMTAVEKNQVKAEMTILKAYRYEEMLKRYGGVPIVHKTLTAEDELNLPRASVQDLVNYIVGICDSVAETLVAKHPGESGGRINKGVALAVKAEALMFAARPLFNSANPYLSMGQYDQLISFGNYDAGRWQKAIEANLAVLNWASANGHRIINTGDPFNDYGRAVAIPGNEEVLLAYKNQSGRKGGNGNYYDPHGPSGGANSMSFIQLKQYYKEDGTDQTWPGGNYDDYWTRMQEMEPRYKVSAVAAGQDAWNNPGDYYWSSIVLSNASTWEGRDGTEGCGRRAKFWYHAGNRPWFEFPIYRLAENYLNLAEAYNEINNNTEALKYLNVIRNRAGLPSANETNQDKLRELIQREWAVEFYEENHRYFDVKHWKHPDVGNGIIGGEKTGFVFTYNNRSYGEKPADYNSYIVKKLYDAFWNPSQFLEPFPIAEVNKGYLKQNPGY